MINMEEMNLAYLKINVADIPDTSGTYYWYHWPQFPDSIARCDLIKLLQLFSSRNLIVSEEIFGLRNNIKITERIFELRNIDNTNTILGLSEFKSNELLKFIFNDDLCFSFFRDFFKEMCFSRPFYIGKAKNLRSRFVYHFERRNSKILDRLDEFEIPQTEVWISWKETPNLGDTEMAYIFEEIIQRKLKPGLVEKYGQ
jgi:hypothetical protein